MAKQTQIQDDFVPKIFRSAASFFVFLLFLFGLPFALFTVFTLYETKMILINHLIEQSVLKNIITITILTSCILLSATLFAAMAWGYTIKKFNLNKKKQIQREMQNLYHLSLRKAELEQMELFSFILAHNLHEPLNKISLFTNYVKEEGGNLTEEQVNALDRILKSNQKMSDQIERVEDLVAIMTADNAVEKINLKQLIYERLQNQKNAIDSKNMKIELGNFPLIYTDKKKLTKIIDNLIENSIKFHKNGSLPKITVNGRQHGHSIFLSIEDNGIGIPTHYLQQLFKPFKQMHGKEFKGFGIGLATCKKLALALCGDIQLESESGKGTKVTITLPANLSEAINTQEALI